MSATDQQLRTVRRIRWVFGVVGVVVTLVGVVLLARAIVFVSTAIPVQAEVVSVEALTERHRDSDGRTSTMRTYLPMFEFHDAEGRMHTATTNHSSSDYNYSVGQTVTIRYNPANPETIRVDSFFGIWGAAVIVLPLGMAALVVAGVVMPRMVRQLQLRHAERQRQAPVTSDLAG